MIEIFKELHSNLLTLLPTKFRRQSLTKLDPSARAIGLHGPRGVGKTTLLLQHAKEAHGGPDRCLYISADHVAAAAAGLFQLGRQYFQDGGDALILDEVHRAQDWGRQVKSLIDSYPNKKFYLSGSSALALRERDADLSRRVVWYKLPGLSFREYLALAYGTEFPIVSWSHLLEHHGELASDLRTKRPNILAEFHAYLRTGVYPFFVEGGASYLPRLLAVLDKVLSEDIPDLFGLERTKIPSLRRLLWIICSSAPFKPNIEGLSRDLGLAKESVYFYIECLEKAGLLKSYKSSQTGAKQARKAAKIYPANTNLLAAIVSQASLTFDQGMVREVFFQSMVSEIHEMHTHPKADFVVDSKWVFEVGGPSKDLRQIHESKSEGFLALDGLEVGSGQRIPLYLFGFIY